MEDLTTLQFNLLVRLGEDKPLPAQRQLARELGSTVTSVNTAFAALVYKGLLVVRADV